MITPSIVADKRNDYRKIFKTVRNQLSDKEIRGIASKVINKTLDRSITNRKQGIISGISGVYSVKKDEIKPKIRVSLFSKPNTLVGGVGLEARPLTVHRFQAGIDPNRGGGVFVNIKKQQKLIRTAFIAKSKKNNTTQVFARGKYGKTGFIWGQKERYPISVLKTASVRAMGLNPKIARPAQLFIENDCIARVTGALQQKINKLKNIT